MSITGSTFNKVLKYLIEENQITDPDHYAIVERVAHSLLNTNLLERVKIEEEVKSVLDELVRLRQESVQRTEEERKRASEAKRLADEVLAENDHNQKDALAIMLTETMSASGKTASEISVLTGLSVEQVEELMKR